MAHCQRKSAEVAAPALIIAKTAQATNLLVLPHRNGMDTVIGIEGRGERPAARMARSSKCGGSISFTHSFS
jgi:hypothetical protein